MKRGFLKPLRYISQMFDGKEHEMQIGFPTDVRHVAHIGCDGPNMNAPHWMKDFYSAPLGAFGLDENANPSPWGSQEFNIRAGIEDNPSGEMMPRRSRRSAEPTAKDSPNNAPRPRHSRRHQSESTADSANLEPTTDGFRRGSRRQRKKDGESAAAAGGDLPAIPKQSRRRSKESGSAGSGDSIRASRSKNYSASASEERGTAPHRPRLETESPRREEKII